MLRTHWKFFSLALLVALIALRCAPPKKLPLFRPTQVEVEGAGPLVVTVADMQKRPLSPGELTATDKAGFFWEYRVRVANPTNVTVRLERLHLKVHNLWGARWEEDQPLNVRVDGGGQEEILVQARLATSDPTDRPGLKGVETLTFWGRDDNGRPVSFLVRVPLD